MPVFQPSTPQKLYVTGPICHGLHVAAFTHGIPRPQNQQQSMLHSKPNVIHQLHHPIAHYQTIAFVKSYNVRRKFLTPERVERPAFHVGQILPGSYVNPVCENLLVSISCSKRRSSDTFPKTFSPDITQTLTQEPTI
jgi:hypothetical protein